MSTKNSNEFDLIFKALADSKRRKILDMLSNLPMTTGYICQSFPDLGRVTIMQHLGTLEKAGLITVERKGKHRWNYLNRKPIEAVHKEWVRKHLVS